MQAVMRSLRRGAVVLAAWTLMAPGVALATECSESLRLTERWRWDGVPGPTFDRIPLPAPPPPVSGGPLGTVLRDSPAWQSFWKDLGFGSYGPEGGWIDPNGLSRFWSPALAPRETRQSITCVTGLDGADVNRILPGGSLQVEFVGSAPEYGFIDYRSDGSDRRIHLSFVSVQGQHLSQWVDVEPQAALLAGAFSVRVCPRSGACAHATYRSAVDA